MDSKALGSRFKMVSYLFLLSFFMEDQPDIPHIVTTRPGVTNFEELS